MKTLYARTSRPSRWGLPLMGLAAAWALWSYTTAPVAPPPVSAGASPHAADAHRSPASSLGSTPPTSGASDRQDEVARALPADAFDPSPQEVAALKDALRDEPDRDAELTRLIQYSRFQKQTDRWRELKDKPLGPERIELARQLVQSLPDHYAQGELMGAQALAMLETLVADLEPAPQRRADRMAQEKARLAAAAPAPSRTQQQADQAFSAFQQKQAALVAEYESRPAALRDPARLEAQLDALRQDMLKP